MSTIQAVENQRRLRTNLALQADGATAENLPLVLIGVGISVNVLTAFRLGGPAGVLTFLLGESAQLLISIPLTVLLLIGITWLSNIYFGTLRQAVVRLAAFSITCQAVGVLMLVGLPLMAAILWQCWR